MNYPSIHDKPYLAIDTETKDDGLATGTGPGWTRNRGYVCGISIAWPGGSIYLPIAHPEGNLDKKTVVDYLNRELGNPNQTKVFANQPYDIGWLSTIDVKVAGRCEDIQIIEPLLDEHRITYSLDSLAEKYLGEHKADEGMVEWCKKAGLKIKASGDDREHIWKMPSQIVAPYAKVDTELTLAIWEKQLPLLEEQDLMKVFDIETRLTPVIIDMMSRGIKVDLDATEKARIKISQELDNVKAQIKHVAGKEVNYNASKSLYDAFRDLGYRMAKTDEGRPSLPAKLLETNTDNLSPLILKARQLNKVIGTFLEGAILDKNYKGRIYANINQLKGEAGGTIARLSYSDPNLQQIPSKDKFIGPLIRGLFMPEDSCRWGSFDFSEQEPRFTVHYSSLRNLPGAPEAVEYYHTDPEPSFHKFVQSITGLPRDEAKVINLGTAYGMGIDKLRASLGCTKERAKVILEQYHKRMPFIKALSKELMDVAQQRGYIRTIKGRRMRYPMWEPNISKKEWFRRRDQGIKVPPVPYEEAFKKNEDPKEVLWHHQGIKRAYTYAALNNLDQGSAADQTKLSMVNVYEYGLRPCLQIHDELDDAGITSDKQLTDYKEIMEDSIKLRVPSKVSVEVGSSWGDSKYGSSK